MRAWRCLGRNQNVGQVSLGIDAALLSDCAVALVPIATQRAGPVSQKRTRCVATSTEAKLDRHLVLIMSGSMGSLRQPQTQPFLEPFWSSSRIVTEVSSA